MSEITVPQDVYGALYRLYLECRDARLQQQRLPRRVGVQVTEVASAFRAHGCDEEGMPRDATLYEREAAKAKGEVR